MTYLTLPAARHRWGVSIIEAFDADGHVIRYPYERLSVRPEPVVITEPVDPEEGWFLGVAFMGALLGIGMLLGWAT